MTVGAALARARRARRAAGVLGDTDFVPVDRAQAAVRAAYAAGVAPTALSRESGLDTKRLRSIAEGRQAVCRLGTERIVLRAVEACLSRNRKGEVSPRRLDAAPTRELLHRLGAAGWPVVSLMREYGIPDNTYRSRAKYVRPEVAEAVQRLYDDIDGRMGDSLQSARHWRKRGAVVPAAEDPDDMLPLPPTARSLVQRWAI